MIVQAISWKVQNGLKLILVHTYMLMRGSAGDNTIILSYILLELSVLNSFHKKVIFFVMSWCTSSVYNLQLMPFLDNRLLGSIPRFHQFPC